MLSPEEMLSEIERLELENARLRLFNEINFKVAHRQWIDEINRERAARVSNLGQGKKSPLSYLRLVYRRPPAETP